MQLSRDKLNSVLSTAYTQDGELLVTQQFHRYYLGVNSESQAKHLPMVPCFRAPILSPTH